MDAKWAGRLTTPRAVPPPTRRPARPGTDRSTTWPACHSIRQRCQQCTRSWCCNGDGGRGKGGLRPPRCQAMDQAHVAQPTYVYTQACSVSKLVLCSFVISKNILAGVVVCFPTSSCRAAESVDAHVFQTESLSQRAESADLAFSQGQTGGAMAGHPSNAPQGGGIGD